MAEFRVNIDTDGEVIEDKRDVTIQDTANPFGNQAIIRIEDDGGENYDKFPFGTRVEIDARELVTDFEAANALDLTVESGEVFGLGESETEQYRRISNAGRVSNQGRLQSIADDSKDTFQQRFSGFVVQRDDKKQSGGRDLTEVIVYSFDQLLRADSVSNDQTGKTITAALEDIIKEDTAVTWNAEKVSVEDEQELTESLQGEKVEDALLKLSTKSVDESFGVDDSIEFFFREEETVSAPSDITESNWIDYELPERGKENKNESRTYYDNGERVAVVDDGVNQLELQESLGTDDPIVIAEDRERGDLSNPDDAAETSEQNLQDKEVSRVYKFITEASDFLDATPGETLDVSIQAAGIDDEFVIAAIEYRDREAVAELTCIRNKGNTDDVLRRVTERLRRKELENADFDGPQDRINQSEVAVLIENSVTVDGTSWDRTRVTNALRNQIRDGWGGQGNVDVSEIAVGTDPADLSRTNDSLQNEVARTSVSETLNGTDGVAYDVSVSQTDIQEIGLFDSSGNLLYRAVNDTSESPGNVSISLTVQNDSEVPKAVVTNLGQESIRDIIADNSPQLPVNYGFGGDQTEPAITDNTLGDQVFVASLSETLIQDAPTQDELSDLVGSISSGTPLTVNSNGIETKQTNYVREGETQDRDSGGTEVQTPSDADASDGEYILMQNSAAAFAEYDFSTEHPIEPSDFALFVRAAQVTSVNNNFSEFSVTLDRSDGTTNTIVDEFTFSDIEDEWDWYTIEDTAAGFDVTTTIPEGSHTLRIEGPSAGDAENLGIDIYGFADNQYTYTLENTVDSNNYLSGPELYPELVERQFAETAQTRRELDFAKAVVDIDDTSNNQFIELSNDGGSTFIRTDNSDTATASFSSPSNEVISRIGLSRYGSRTTATPTTGFNPQTISTWSLFANPLAVVPDGIGTSLTIGLIPRGEITGSVIAEVGQLDTNENALTRAIRAELEVLSDMRVFGRERLEIRQP